VQELIPTIPLLIFIPDKTKIFLVDSEWFHFIVYGGGSLGIVIFILLFVCLIRIRLRRSQHKCTVRQVRGAAISEDAGKPAPAVRSRSSESQVLETDHEIYIQ